MMTHIISNRILQNALKRWGILLALVLASSGIVRAQGSFPWAKAVDVSGSYTYIRGNSDGFVYGFHVNGGTASLSYRFNGTFAVAGDVGVYRFGSLPPGLHSTMYTYLFGPRVSLHKFHRIVPFVEVLAGGGRLNASSVSVQAGENGFALAAGGGLDALLSRHFSLRVVQADYLLTRFDHPSETSASQNDVRISAGLVFYFGNGGQP